VADETELPALVIDGRHFSDLEGFYDEISFQLIPGAKWGRSLDAFNDILRGGFGTPEGGFHLRWVHSHLSQERLGWEETILWIERKLATTNSHSPEAGLFQIRLDAARRHEGATMFDRLVEIIRIHGPGGDEADDGVLLVLE
jgi:RNAse (barnase) inhibitor barstar